MKIDNALPLNVFGQTSADNEPKLAVGDVLRAKVTEISQSDVSLKLPNGTSIKASLSTPSDAKTGDFVELKVKSLENNAVIVELVNDKASKNNFQADIEKALTSIGKEITPQNIEYAKVLIENHFKVTAENFNILSDTVTSNKSQGLTAPKALFLLENNVPINPENIKLFDSFVNKNLNIVESFSNISSKLANLDEKQLEKIVSRISLLEQFEELPKLIETFSKTSQNTSSLPDVDALIDKEISNITNKFFEQTPKNETSVFPLSGKTTGNTTIANNPLTKAELDDLLAFINKMPEDKIVNFFNKLDNTNKTNRETLINSTLNILDTKTSGLAEKNNNSTLLNLLKNFIDSEDTNIDMSKNLNSQKIIQNEISKSISNNLNSIIKSIPDNEFSETFVKVFSKELNILISQISENSSGKSENTATASNLSGLITNNNLEKLFLKCFKDSVNQAFLDPTKMNSSDASSKLSSSTSESVATKELSTRIFESCFVRVNENLNSKDIDVKDIYEKIIRRLSIIDDVIKGNISSSNTTSNASLSNSISSLDKQIGFLNSINSNQTYIQIPLIYGGNKNGELYIIKKKRSANDNEAQGTTVYLSLNTTNIGRFETLVNLEDNKLKINIRLEKNDLVDFVRGNYPMIYNLLEKTKYKIVDIKCKKATEELDPISIDAVIKNEFTGNSKSIDFKV